jgi:O-antigen/teichoic acid export membrane protein
MMTEAEVPFWQRRSWLVQTGKAGAAIYLSAVLGFVTSIIMARVLGPASFGRVVLAIATVGSIAALLDFSLEEAVVHFGAVALTKQDFAGVRGLIRRSLTLDLLVGIVVFIAISATAGVVGSLAGAGRLASSFIIVAALDALAGTANGTTGAVLLLSGRPDLRAWALSWTSLFRLLFVVTGVGILHVGPLGVLAALAGGSLVGAALQTITARSQERRHWGDARPGPPPVPIRRLAGFGAQSSITTSLIALRLALVTVVLGRGAGPVAVGFLAVAMLPVTLADVATSPIRTAAFAEQAKLAAAGRHDLLRQAIRRYTSIALVVGVLASTVGWFLIPHILPGLYGERFSADVQATRSLLPAAVAGLTVAWAKSLPAAVGKPLVRTIASLVEVVATLLAVLALAHRGPEGVAAAISVVAVVMAVVWIVIARRLLRDPRGRQLC